MTKEPTAGKQFISALLAIEDLPEATLAALESEVKSSLLAFGSETGDNVACAERIGVEDLPYCDYGRIVGPTIKSRHILISDILNNAEGSAIPASLQEQYPELEQDDWNAVLRIATLAFTAFQRISVTSEEKEDS